MLDLYPQSPYRYFMQTTIVNPQDIDSFLRSQIVSPDKDLVGLFVKTAAKLIGNSAEFFKATQGPAKKAHRKIYFVPELAQKETETFRGIAHYLATAATQKGSEQRARLLVAKFENSAEIFTSSFAAQEKAGDIRTIEKFKDGSRIVELCSAYALMVENKHLGHSMGIDGDSYRLRQDYTKDERPYSGLFSPCYEGEPRYYSFRDANNVPEMTLCTVDEDEATLSGHRDTYVSACRGKGNTLPTEQNLDRLHAFIRKKKFMLNPLPFLGSHKVWVSETGLLRDDKGEYHDVRNLPQDFTWNPGGRYPLTLQGAQWLKRLPDNMTVKTTLDLTRCVNLDLAKTKNLSVNVLIIEECPSITAIPASLSAKEVYWNAQVFKDMTVLRKAFRKNRSVKLARKANGPR